MSRAIWEITKGWFYLAAFITGGNFIRKSRLKKCGLRVKVSPTAMFKFPENIEIGNDSFINHLCSVWASQKAGIYIGNDVLLGPGTTIVSANHGIAAGTLVRLQQESEADVRIGNDVWIGAHVVVTPGVIIGDGCIVGAGSIVTRDLPEQSICVGVPARVIGFRTVTKKNEEEVEG